MPIDNSFFPEPMALACAMVSVFLCVLVYKARSLLGFAWNAPGMNVPVGSGRTHQIDPDDGPSQNAARGAGNVMNNMTPGGGAVLMVLAFFLFGIFFGLAALPAALGVMGSITTLNLLLLLVCGLAWGLLLGRLTVTLLSLAMGLAVWGLAIVVVLFVLNFVVTFLRGGNDFFMKSALQTMGSTQAALTAYTRGGKDSWYGAYEKRVNFNLCSAYEGLKSYGDIRQVRTECDRSWVAAQQQQALHAKQDQVRADQAFELARQEHERMLKRLADGLPANKVPSYWKSMAGTWSGVFKCESGLTGVRLILQGDNQAATGVLQFFPYPLQSGNAAHYGAFHVAATQSGTAVAVQAGSWIQQPAGQSSFDLKFKQVAAFIPGLVEAAASRPGCMPLDLRAAVQASKG